MRLPQSGEILENKYRLENVLGQGAFGVVFRATTLSTNRPVAVKVLKPAPDSRSGSRSARFLRELRTIANLQCPNTLTLYDYGRTNDGVLFMVTEYIEGEDLYDLIARRGHLEEHEVIHILYQSLLSLAEAHDLNVLHRDIKPHNIRLFEYQGEPLQVKILDFGLSKSLEDEPGAALTGVGLIVGTPRYMSPEQLRGKDLTPASDIYSLGLVAYEALLGRPAVALDAMVGQTRPVQITSDDNVTRALRDVVNKMLQRPLAERYKSAAEVQTALRPLRARGPVDASMESDTIADTTSVTELLGERPERLRHLPPPRSSGWTTAAPILGTIVIVLLLMFASMQGWKAWKTRTVEDDSPRRIAPRPMMVQKSPTPDVVAPDVPDAGTPIVTPTPTPDGCRGLETFKPGIQKLGRLAGITREEALVRLPDGYDPTKRYPLVWIFNDYMNTAESMIKGLEYDTVNDLEPFIVLASQSDKITAWALPHEFDNAQVGLDVATELLCVDPDRLYVWGHGFGGRVATRRAMCLDSVAAVATSAYRERLPDKLCNPKSVVPYLHIGVTRDGIAPPEGGRGCFGDFLPAAAPSLDASDAFYKKRHGCDSTRREVFTHENGTCHTWHCKSPFVSCRVDGGRPLPNVPTDARACVTSAAQFPFTREVFRFFSKSPRRERESAERER